MIKKWYIISVVFKAHTWISCSGNETSYLCFIVGHIFIKYVLLFKDFGILCPFWWIHTCFWFHQVANAMESKLCERLTCSQPQNSQYIHKLGWETGWGHSLLSLAFATRWNQKHPSYICICFLKFHLTGLLRKADYMRCLKLLTSWVMFWL